MGKLNFASMFIPEYKKRISPLLELLGKKSDGKWTEQHTKILNSLGQIILGRMKLGLVDSSKAATLFIDEDSDYCTAIMT